MNQRVMIKTLSKHKKYLFFGIIMLVVFAVPITRVNAAATITVNSTADDQNNDGECTLREAIVASNTDTASGAAVGECTAGSGADTIEFDISGTGLKTIHISSGMPTITRTVTIDGYTQTDAVVNNADFPDAMNGTLTVEIDAAGESGIYGFDINGSQADGTVIKGLIVNDIPYETFYLTDVDNVSLEGNYIGTSSTGTVADGGSSHGVRIGGSSTGNMIGGATAAKRNVISGNGNTGVLFYGSALTTGNFVQGNFIGVGADGTTRIGNSQQGVASSEGPTGNIIGGDGVGEGNVISGNGGIGVYLSGTGGANTVQGNHIGTNAAGSAGVYNGQGGIVVSNADSNTIGGSIVGARNVISGNSAHGISIIDDSDNNDISGNYVGVGSDGSTAMPNGVHGLLIEGGSGSNTIGGTSSGERNIISGNSEAGVFISGPTVNSNIVQGNYIGTDDTGAVDVGNGSYGLVLDNSPSNTVGGTTGVTVGGDCTGSCNVISGNGDDAIWLYGDSADNNVIKGNHIGTNVAGTGDLGNGGRGVNITFSADGTLVGGTTASDANLIRFNDVRGVSIPNSGSINNAIIGNSLYQNAISNIDLSEDGVTANDANDADNGPNDLLNYPEWGLFDDDSGDTEVTYDLDVPAGDYRIETFSDNGKTLVDSQNITHTGSGAESFSNTITGNNYSNLRMTATEIDGGLSSGFGSTSEYSEAYSDGTEIITVNSTADDSNDDGECTLREAITAANDNTESGISDGECIAGAATDTIEFDIAGAGPHTIQPGAALPSITADGTTINGYSETGAVENSGDYSACFVGTIMIEIDGQNAGSVSGLTISAENVTIRGLAINRFTYSGVYIGSASGTVVAGNILGLDDAGLVDHGNGDAGVDIRSTGDTLIGGTTAADRNLISGNEGFGGISSYADTGTITISGNCIGTDATGDTAIPNNHSGINLYQAEANMVIGGDTTHERNIISGNDENGISISESNVGDIKGNYIGVDADGEADLGNGMSGISADATSSVSYIGGLTSGERNIISGNDSDGIYLADGTGDTRIRGNYIGVDATGAVDLGNTDDGIIAGSTDIIIGGTASGARNVVSGNGAEGIELSSTATTALVQGNYIGLSASGSSGIGNTNIGLSTMGINTIVGGTASGAENVVSDNGAGGISVDGDDTTVIGNLVGTSADGLSEIGNTSVGIKSGGDNVIIGGDSATERNVVAGTIVGGNYAGSGIVLLSFGSGGSGGVVKGNYVGTNINGTVGGGFGNGGFGIFAIGDYSNGVIGGTASGEGNKVVSSGMNGIGANGFAGFGLYTNNISILGNQVYQSTSTGIRLMADTNGDFQPDTPIPFPNDAGDGDVGPNDYLNFPVLNSSSASAGSLDVNFDLDIPNTNTGVTGYRLEFFANDTGDASGNGEGQIYLGSANVSGDVSSHSETITLDPGVITTGDYDISATVTEIDGSADGFGSTSEFSAFLDNQEIIQPLDNDDDGVNDAVEDAGPNGGDGNDDGTQDSEQASVATILDAESDDYVTLALDSAGVCDQIDDFASKLESELSESDPDFIYPLTLVEFTIPCEDSVDGTLFWHGEEEFTTQIYRKFGPTTPGDVSSTSWYTSEQFITSTVDIDGNATATASFTLTDGEAGDDTGNDNVIVDANGPGLEVETTDSVVDSISSAVSDALSATGMNQYGIYAIAGALIIGGSVFIVKRKYQSRTSK